MYYSTVLMVALFVTGTINSVVSKRMFDAYTDKYAYFANQVGVRRPRRRKEGMEVRVDSSAGRG